MKRVAVLLVCLVGVLACGVCALPPLYQNPQLMPYVAAFVEDFPPAEINLPRLLGVNWGPLPDRVAGRCTLWGAYSTGAASGSITLNRDAAETQIELGLRTVMYHELLHCLCGIHTHTDNPLTLLYPEAIVPATEEMWRFMLHETQREVRCNGVVVFQ